MAGLDRALDARYGMIDWDAEREIGAKAMGQVISFNRQQDEHVWLWVYTMIAKECEDESYLLKIAAVLWRDFPD